MANRFTLDNQSGGGNPLQGLLGAVQAGQGFRQNQVAQERNQQMNALEQQLVDAAGQEGYDPLNNPAMQKLAVLNPKQASNIAKTASGLSNAQEKSFFKDAEKAHSIITNENIPMTQRMGLVHELASKRREKIAARGGDTMDTDLILQAVEGGNLQEAVSGLAFAVQQGTKAGFLGEKQGTGTAPIQNYKFLQGLRRNVKEAKTPEAKESANLALEDFQKTANLRKLSEQESIFQKQQSKIQVALQKSNITVDEKKRLEKELSEKTLKIKKTQEEITRNRLKDAEKANQLRTQRTINIEENNNAIESVDFLLKDDLYTSAFGKLVSITPDLAKTESQLTARSRIDQLEGLLALEARKKLKGHGTITDGEMTTLQKSISLLQNEKLPDAEVKKELNRIRRIFENSKNRDQALLDYSNKNNPQQNNDLLQQSDNSLPEAGQVDPRRARLEAARERKRQRGG